MGLIWRNRSVGRRDYLRFRLRLWDGCGIMDTMGANGMVIQLVKGLSGPDMLIAVAISKVTICRWQLAQAIADALYDDNSQFDREAFYHLCEVSVPQSTHE